MKPLKKILAATDFSDCSRAAVDVAVSLAGQMHAELTLLHVWEIPVYPYVELVLASTDLVNEVEKAASNQLQQELERVQRRVPEARSVLAMGPAWQQVLETAKTVDASLIVMGTHGRRGLSHLLMGSVAERVARLSEVPVLTVPLGR